MAKCDRVALPLREPACSPSSFAGEWAGVGGRERRLIALPTAINTGGGSARTTIMLPRIAGLDTGLILGGFYGGGDRDESGRIAAEPGVVSGVSYWQRADDDSTGISSASAGLNGSADLAVDVFEIASGLGFDVSPLLANLTTLLRSEPATAEKRELDRLLVAEPLAAPPAATVLEVAASVGYIHQDASEYTVLSNQSPGFSLFDVRSSNHMELTEWSALASLGLVHSHPLAALPGLTFRLGGSVGIGYRDSNGDGRQHNQCDVRFAAAPGTNVCAPEVRDFAIERDFDTSGFDWSLGATAALAYELVCWADGLSVGLDYEFRYLGISRFLTPTNLEQDGPARIERSHQPRHRIGVSLAYAF